MQHWSPKLDYIESEKLLNVIPRLQIIKGKKCLPFCWTKWPQTIWSKLSMYNLFQIDPSVEIIDVDV